MAPPIRRDKLPALLTKLGEMAIILPVTGTWQSGQLHQTVNLTRDALQRFESFRAHQLQKRRNQVLGNLVPSLLQLGIRNAYAAWRRQCVIRSA